MTEPERHLMKVRASESRVTKEDVLALLAEIERLERDLAESHGIIDGLKDGIYGRVKPPAYRA